MNKIPRTKPEIMKEYDSIVEYVTGLFETIKERENAMYSLAMEYRNIVIDEKEAEFKGNAKRWKDIYMHD